MKGLKYQLKSVLRDKFCLMTFLLPILVAVALNFMGSIDLSSLGELHFGVLENDLSPQAVTWLGRYGPVTAYRTQEELTAAINEPSTNVIGVKADGDSLKTAISGDELEIFRQAAATLPVLYEKRGNAEQAEVQVLERPDILENFQGIFIPAVLIVAMFMGCTFNAMNIISEKEDGVAFINEILPMTPSQYIFQKVVVGFLFGSLSSIVTACICFKLSWQNFGLMLALIVCRILPLQWVRAGARWLLAEMLLFFVPAVVGVVNYAQLLLVDGWRIFAVIALSTVMVLGTTAWVVEKVYRYEMRRLNRG